MRYLFSASLSTFDTMNQQGKLEPISYAEFGKYRRDMGFYGAFGDAKRIRNRGIGIAPGSAFGDFYFAGG